MPLIANPIPTTKFRSLTKPVVGKPSHDNSRISGSTWGAKSFTPTTVEPLRWNIDPEDHPNAIPGSLHWYLVLATDGQSYAVLVGRPKPKTQ